jgi:deazaflavin-dependent oxidoreductase (nitroreductase family)
MTAATNPADSGWLTGLRKGDTGIATVEVDCAPQHAWKLIGNITRIPEWSPECYRTHWRGTDHEPRPGATFRGWNRRGAALWTSICRVDAVEDVRSLAFTMITGGEYTRWTWTIDAGNTDSSCRISQSWEMLRDLPPHAVAFEKLLMNVHDRAASLQGNIENGLARVKAVLEGTATPAGPSPLVRRFMPFMTRVVLHVGSRVDPPLMRWTGGRLRLIPIRSMLLYTVGAKSGTTRETVLGYLPEGDDVLAVGTNGSRTQLPGWVHNLRANPYAVIRIGNETRSVRAIFVPADEWDATWSRVIAWQPGLDIYRERLAGIREIPIVRLAPPGGRLCGSG